MVIVSFMFLVSGILMISSLFVIILPILNLIGMTNVPYSIGTFLITGFPQVLLGIVFSILLFYISKYSFEGLKKYLKFLERFKNRNYIN